MLENVGLLMLKQSFDIPMHYQAGAWEREQKHVEVKPKVCASQSLLMTN